LSENESWSCHVNIKKATEVSKLYPCLSVASTEKPRDEKCQFKFCEKEGAREALGHCVIP